MQVISGENIHISDKVRHELGRIHAGFLQVHLLSHKQTEEIRPDYCVNTSHPFVLEGKRKWK